MSWKNETRYWKDKLAKVDPQLGSSAIPPASRNVQQTINTDVGIQSNVGAEATLRLVYVALKGPLHGKSPKALLQLIESGYPEIKQQAVTEPASMNRTEDGMGAA